MYSAAGEGLGKSLYGIAYLIALLIHLIKLEGQLL